MLKNYPLMKTFYTLPKTIVLLGLLTISLMASVSVKAQLPANKQDSLALVALYDSTGGNAWLKKWDLHTPVNKWAGVTLSANGRVIALNLTGIGLSGKIPSSIVNLSNLVSLKLANNKFKGAIPSFLGNLVNLTVLDLSGDSLTGAIPTFIGSLSSLTSLGLSNNTLSGIIPTNLWGLKKLTNLALNGNKFNDTIPSSVSNLSVLTRLDLSACGLQGKIPSGIGSLKSLSSLNLSGNKLSGSIPAAIGGLSNLVVLDVSGNGLTGGIPTALGNLASVSFLNLGGNNLVGTIPTSIGGLKNLAQFWLYGNNLSDTLPAAILLTLGKLTSLDLSLNNFTFSSFEKAQDLAKKLGNGFIVIPQRLIPVHQTKSILSVNGGGTLKKKAYHWIGVDALGKNIVDTTIYRDSTFAPKYTASYTVSVSDSLVAQVKLYGTPLLVRLAPALTIVANPSTEICIKTPVTLQALVINNKTTLTYQWKKDGKNVGTNSNVYKDSLLNNGDSVICVLTDSGKTISSNVLKFVVKQKVTAAAVINDSTFGNTICPGVKVRFTATTTGAGTAPTYQWYKNGITVGKNTPDYLDSLLKTGDSIILRLTSSEACTVKNPVYSNKLGFTVRPGKPATPTITGPASVKARQTGVVFKTPYVAGVNYIWAVPSGDTIKAGQGTDSITVKWGTSAGTVSLKEENTCGISGEATKAVAITPGIANFKYTPEVNNVKAQVYPNPVVDVAHLQLNGFNGNVVVTVTDLAGKVVLVSHLATPASELQLSLSAVAPGIYFVTIKDKQTNRTLRVVKTK